MRKVFIGLLVCLFSLVGYAQNSIIVNVHNVVEAGEQFNVTFIIDGKVGSDEFSWTPTEDLQLLWGPQYGTSTSINIENGKRTSSVQTTFTYVVMASKPGKYTIPSASLQTSGKSLSSEARQIEVVEALASEEEGVKQEGQPKSTARVSSKDLFMRFEVDKNSVVMGEPVHVALKLYHRVNLAGLDGFSLPDFDGFWKKELKRPSNLEFVREKYDGQLYQVATLCEYVMIPQQIGKLKIEPAELTCLINVLDDSYGRSELDFFFRGGYRTINKKIFTKPVTVKVSPLPTPAPASATGGVGKFTITAQTGADSLSVNDASSLTVTVGGTGNISLITEPVVSFPPDFEVYDVKASERIDAGGVSGQKKFEFPFIPRSGGDFVIPSIKFSYYDISQREYVTLETDPISIFVKKDANAANHAAVGSDNIVKSFSQKEVGNLNTDILYISRDMGRLRPKGSFFLGSTPFWVVLLVMSGLSFVLWYILNGIMERKADVVGTRTKKATKMALKRLKKAKTYLDQNIQVPFYEELHKALLGFVADRLNVPYGELSKDRIAELLSAHGVDATDYAPFLTLLDECEFARYAPSSDNRGMADYYQSAIDVISVLDSKIKKTNKNSMKQTLTVIMLFLIPVLSMNAGNNAVLWEQGNSAYAEGQWKAAEESYGAIIASGVESADVYYNLANAYFKQREYPMAILNYNRALKLDPSYKDAEYNLGLANARIKDRIETVPEFIFKTWMRKFCYLLDSDAWVAVFLVSFVLLLSMVLLFLLASSTAGRKAGFFTGLAAVVFVAVSLSMSAWQKNSYYNDEAAIVMKEVMPVMSSPSLDNSTELFLLHEGTKIGLLQEEDDWYEIELSDGRRGWILTRDVEKI